MRASVLAKDAVNRRSLRLPSAFKVSPDYRCGGFPNPTTRVSVFAVGVDEERAGRNEALFREVNDNVARLEEELEAEGSDLLPVICECARTDCVTRFEIRLADYVRVRSHPHQFIVARGHEQPEVERVVRESDEYVVVEKDGVAALAAYVAS